MKIRLQKGLSLIELMIAALLSLIIVLFITNIMITSNRTGMQSEGLAQAQENGRFILSWLQGHLRQAGQPYPSNSVQERIQPFAEACSSTLLPPSDNADCSFDSANTNESDRIAIRRTYVKDDDLKTEISDKDCSGQSVVLVDKVVVTDVYWVDPPGSDEEDPGGILKCATYDDSHQVIGGVIEIANGIEGLQVLYGLKPSVDSQYRSNINRYVPLDEVSDWKMVGAIRVGILTRAAAERSLDKKSRKYILLDAAPVVFDDSVARHIQTTTIFLPNE